MDRALPEFNRVLHKKWLTHEKQAYRQRLYETKPVIDNNLPASLKYPIIKTKKEQILEDRCTEIEKANRILLEKMTSIMTTALNKKQSLISGHMSVAAIKDASIGGSLNRGVRQKEISRITQENESLLRRLQARQSHYNVCSWESDRKKQEKMLKKICYYPPSLLRRTSRTRGRQHQWKDPNSDVFTLYQQNLKQMMATGMGGVPRGDLQNVSYPDADGMMDDNDMQGEVAEEVYQTAPVQHVDLVEMNESQQVKEGLSSSMENRSQILNPTSALNQTRELSRRQLRPVNTQGSNTGPLTNFSPPQRPMQRQVNLVARKRPPPMNIGYNDHGIDASRQVLYRNFHQIQGTVFLVEISRSARKVFILLFPNFEMGEIFKLCILAEKQAQKLMCESNNQFEEFVKRFYIKYDKLQIEGFHGTNTRSHRSVSPTRKFQQMLSQVPKKTRVQQLKQSMSFLHHSQTQQDQQLHQFDDGGDQLIEAVDDALKLTQKVSALSHYVDGEESKKSSLKDDASSKVSVKDTPINWENNQSFQHSQSKQLPVERSQQSLKASTKTIQSQKKEATSYILPADTESENRQSKISPHSTIQKDGEDDQEPSQLPK